MRLQRWLALAGVASRRKAERLIVDGHVTVNGKPVTELGSTVDPQQDVVAVDGRQVEPQQPIYLLLHKPPRCICSTHDPEGRQTVIDLVRPATGARLYPVGRLDYDTTGVLLLTNDGELAQALLHPRYGVPRIYHVKVRGLVQTAAIERLREGVSVDGTLVRAETEPLARTDRNTWIEMTLHQGLNHQIHRMLEAVGYTVLRIIRVSFAGLRADDLPPARYRELTPDEAQHLRSLCELSPTAVGSKKPAATRRKTPPRPNRRR